MRISDAAQKKASNIKLVIIDPPTAPRVPVAPNRVLLAIAVLLGGLGAGAGVIMAMLALDQSFHNIADLRALGYTVIGSVSLAVLPLTAIQRLRQIALFGGAMGALFVALGATLVHFARMT
jgi:uncharacterized protein involved in exopolysaccharide biosynthesis